MLTRLIVIRHAKPKNEGYADELLRPLSEEGIAIQNIMNNHLVSLGITPNIIYSSPILRAIETATLIAKKYEIEESLKITDSLGYNFDESKLLSLIPSPKLNQTIFFVGHAPTLAEFVHKLVGEESLPEGLNTSSIAIIDFRDEIDFKRGNFTAVYHYPLQ